MGEDSGVLSLAHNLHEWSKPQLQIEGGSPSTTSRDHRADDVVLRAVCAGFAQDVVSSVTCTPPASSPKPLVHSVSEACVKWATLNTGNHTSSAQQQQSGGSSGRGGTEGGVAAPARLRQLLRASARGVPVNRAEALNAEEEEAGGAPIKRKDCDRLAPPAARSTRPRNPVAAAAAVVVTAFDNSHAAVAQRAALPALRCAGGAAWSEGEGGGVRSVSGGGGTEARQFPAAAAVVVYDLGLSPAVRLVLEAQFEAPAFTWRRFEFERYPEHFRLGRQWTPDGAGEYAWKVAAIAEVAAESRYRAKVLWCDAGNWIDPNLLRNPGLGLWYGIGSRGLLSPRSSGTVGRWTFGTPPSRPASSPHQPSRSAGSPHRAGSPSTPKAGAGGMWAYFNASDRVALFAPLEKNCHGALVGLDVAQPPVRRLLDAWLDCALHRECIAPKGSHRGNHRQDQAALTLLVLLSKDNLFGADYLSCRSMSDLALGPSSTKLPPAQPLHPRALSSVSGGGGGGGTGPPLPARGLDPTQVRVRAAEDAANWPNLALQYYQCRSQGTGS